MTVVKTKPRTTSAPADDHHLRRRRRRRSLLRLISAVTASTHTFLHRKHHHDHLNPYQTLSLSSTLTSLSPHTLLPLPISQSSFSLLLSLLTPSLSVSLPSSIPPFSALSSALLRLSSPDFPSSPRSFFLVLKAVVDKFGGLLIGDAAAKEKAVVGFGWKSLPNCCGVLGFGKFKKRNGGSVLVQALVDSEGRFLDLSAGWDGRLKGSVILGKTGFFRDVEAGRKFLCGHKYELGDGFGLNQYVLGEACFPLLPWLLTPYGRTVARCNEDDEAEGMESFGLKEGEFNRVHAREMESVRKAFSRVRRRFRLLSMLWDEDWAEYFPVIVFAACLLNNFLVECGESEDDAYMEEEGEVAMEEDQGDEEELLAYKGAVDECGVMVRNALAEHLVKVSLRV